jgi:alginate O-acetyltransferase complex protein AlgI
LRHAYVWLVILITWVVFRATTLSYALAYLAAMAGVASGTGIDFYPTMYLNTELLLALGVAAIAAMPVLPWLARLQAQLAARPGGAPGIATSSLALGSVVVQMALLLASAAQLASGTHNPFIYFRF